jgi:hypothetical protein
MKTKTSKKMDFTCDPPTFAAARGVGGVFFQKAKAAEIRCKI